MVLTANEIESFADSRVEDIQAVLSGIMTSIIDHYAASGQVITPDTAVYKLETILKPFWSDIIVTSGLAIRDEFQEYFKEESLFDRFFEQFFEMFGNLKIQQILLATSEQVIQIIEQGKRDRIDFNQTVKRLYDAIPELTKLRAHVIARTESHSASQYASIETAKTSIHPLVKQWNAGEDHRTRDFGEGGGKIDQFNHRVMDGVQVEMDAPFQVPMKNGGTEAMMYPGDPNGSPGNVIMCRCVMTYKRRAD